MGSFSPVSHVLGTFDGLERGKDVLHVHTDLPVTPGQRGFDADALRVLSESLAHVIKPNGRYDLLKFHHEHRD